MNNTNRFFKFFVFLAFVSESICAYEISEHGHWPDENITMVVNVQGADGLWNATFETAMARWSEVTDFNFFITKEFSDPCDTQDKRNGVAFVATNCGDEFGSALAVTLTFVSDNDSAIKTETDMVFNNTRSWNVYEGSEKTAVGGEALIDFRRVALHELGHVLGLGHSPQGSNSIMGPNIASIDSLRQDDVNGAKGVNNVVFMEKCINNFRQYVGTKSGKGYECGQSSFTCHNTTGGSRLRVTRLALPHDAEPNDTLWYFTNNNGWQTISFTELGFCN